MKNMNFVFQNSYHTLQSADMSIKIIFLFKHNNKRKATVKLLILHVFICTKKTER